MKIIRLANGRRINLEMLALWRVHDDGTITGLLQGFANPVDIINEPIPHEKAIALGRIIDAYATGSDQNVLIDVPSILKQLNDGMYVSEDLDTSKP